ncbi:MAG: hypothetical protein KGK06_13405, partial [Xanthomonadaceae bacterium]|nr:hypothetical protein [Xanthomonadaceae bacterium]
MRDPRCFMGYRLFDAALRDIPVAQYRKNIRWRRCMFASGVTKPILWFGQRCHMVAPKQPPRGCGNRGTGPLEAGDTTREHAPSAAETTFRLNDATQPGDAFMHLKKS